MGLLGAYGLTAIHYVRSDGLQQKRKQVAVYAVVNVQAKLNLNIIDLVGDNCHAVPFKRI